MVSSLRATVEPGAHMEPNVVDLNSLDDEDSDLDSRDCQAGQSNQESRTKSVVHASWDNSPECQTQALKPSPDFLCCGSESQGGAEVDVGSKCVPNGQVSAVYSNDTEKSETHLTPWNQLLQLLPLLEKKVLPYTDDVMNDSSPITLSNEGLDGTNEVETIKASSERVDRGTP